jgi:hypothetical protein
VLTLAPSLDGFSWGDAMEALLSAEDFSRFDVSEDNRHRIEAVQKYDLSGITVGLTDDLIRTGRAFSVEQAYPLMLRYGKADHRLAARLEEEFKRFCVLTLIRPGVPHAPPGAVDMYWHFFILHTQEYADFCEVAWGDFRGDPRYRHHFPSTDETRSGMLDAYRATRALYVEVYGEPHPYEMDAIPGAQAVAPRAIWEVASDTSGDSYSGVIDPRSA